MSSNIYNPVKKILEPYAGNQEAVAAKLDGLADVVAPTPSNGDLLKYNAANEEWENSPKPTYTAAEVGTYSKDEIDDLLAGFENDVVWKEAVATYSDIATTYPNPEAGWTVNVTDTNSTYRYSGSEWVQISASTTPKASASVDGLMSKEDYSKLAGVSAGAQANQNAFSQVKVGGTTVLSGNPSDVLELIGGSKITIVPDTINKTITISADAEPYSVMPVAEMVAGNSETARAMTAKNLKTGLKRMLLDLVYPVGSFYISTNNVSPATFLGGTWLPRSGFFLRAASAGVVPGSNSKDGGNDSVSYTPAGINSGGTIGGTSLSINQIPSHNHMICPNGEVNTQSGTYGYGAKKSGWDDSGVYYEVTTSNTGGGAEHTHTISENQTFTGTTATINTLPSYKNVFMWERTD